MSQHKTIAPGAGPVDRAEFLRRGLGTTGTIQISNIVCKPGSLAAIFDMRLKTNLNLHLPQPRS